MRFQHRDYDNGRYLDEPNFRSNFIHQSTYSTVKSSLVQDQGNTSLKYIESQSRLLLIFLRLPNTPRQTKRAKDHRRKQSDKEGDRKILHPPTHPTDNRRSASIRFLDLTSAGSRSAGDSGIAVQSRQRLRASHDRISVFEPVRSSSPSSACTDSLRAPDPSSSKFEGSSLRAGRSAVSQPLRTDCVHSSYL